VILKGRIKWENLRDDCHLESPWMVMFSSKIVFFEPVYLPKYPPGLIMNISWVFFGGK
jgi:hypothetical protein